MRICRRTRFPILQFRAISAIVARGRQPRTAFVPRKTPQLLPSLRQWAAALSMLRPPLIGRWRRSESCPTRRGRERSALSLQCQLVPTTSRPAVRQLLRRSRAASCVQPCAVFLNSRHGIWSCPRGSKASLRLLLHRAGHTPGLNSIHRVMPLAQGQQQ